MKMAPVSRSLFSDQMTLMVERPNLSVWKSRAPLGRNLKTKFALQDLVTQSQPSRRDRFVGWNPDRSIHFGDQDPLRIDGQLFVVE